MATQKNSGSFASIGDVVSSDEKKEIGASETASESRQERQLLAYLRCLGCKKQMAIQTCGTEQSHRCHDFDNVEGIGESNLHTHIMCDCGEKVFSGVVSFRTARDTDSFNARRKMSWEEKKAQFGKK